jgi:hypothetical protein
MERKEELEMDSAGETRTLGSDLGELKEKKKTPAGISKSTRTKEIGEAHGISVEAKLIGGAREPLQSSSFACKNAPLSHDAN